MGNTKRKKGRGVPYGEFSASDYSGKLEGTYQYTCDTYIQSEHLKLYFGASCSPYHRQGLWYKAKSGKSCYISCLRSVPIHTKIPWSVLFSMGIAPWSYDSVMDATFIFDTFDTSGEKTYFLLIRRIDDVRIGKMGGRHGF